jgi:hypothetical protein
LRILDASIIDTSINITSYFIVCNILHLPLLGRNFYAGYNCTILDMAEERIDHIIPTTRVLLNGGTPKNNALASEHSWRAVLTFLEETFSAH